MVSLIKALFPLLHNSLSKNQEFPLSLWMVSCTDSLYLLIFLIASHGRVHSFNTTCAYFLEIKWKRHRKEMNSWFCFVGLLWGVELRVILHWPWLLTYILFVWLAVSVPFKTSESVVTFIVIRLFRSSPRIFFGKSLLSLLFIASTTV